MRGAMKKLFYFGIVVSVFMLFACGKASVEDVAKDHVKKQFGSDDSLRVDLSKLNYTVTKKEGDSATVSVSGTMQCDGQIFLVKEGGKWRIGKKEGVQASPKKTPSHSATVKETSHAPSKKRASHGKQENLHK